MKVKQFDWLVCVSVVLRLVPVHAGVFRLPITRTTVGFRFGWERQVPGLWKSKISSEPRDRRGSVPPTWLDPVTQRTTSKEVHRDQKPFITNGNVMINENTVYLSMYVLDISIGTPPQAFRARVDNTWGDLFVPSINCTYDVYEAEYCLPHRMYNSTKSSTYQSDLRTCNVAYGFVDTWGKVSQDRVDVAGLEIKDQFFEEATMWRPKHFERDEFYDGALGLALGPLNQSESTLDVANPFENMIVQGLLDRNLYSMKLSRRDTEDGELILGGLPDDLDYNSLITLPLTSRLGPGEWLLDLYASSGWQVSASYISMTANLTSGFINITVPDYTAIISSSFPWIGLPDDLQKQLDNHLGFFEENGAIDCSARPHLPNLTFGLGPKGHSITLTPWDYMIEVYDERRDELTCASSFMDLGDERDYLEFIVLGAPFLNGLWGIFNAHEQTISCG